MIQRQIVIKNLAVNYYFARATDDTVPTVVFLHGWRNNAKIWTPILTSLERQNRYHLYALDLPGFGGSQVPPESWKTEDYAKAVREFIITLGLNKVCVVGHSFGGKVGIKLAANYPESLEKLVLVGSSGIRVESWKNRLVIWLAKIAKPFFAIRFLQNLRPRIYHILGADDYLATPELKSVFLNVVREDLQSELDRITMPVLLVWGDLDRETPLVLGKMMAERLRSARLLVFPKSGHFSFLDRPQEFVESLTSFINESGQSN